MQAGLEDKQELARWSATLAQAVQLGRETKITVSPLAAASRPALSS
jgi:hypothetical protein